MQNSSQKTEGEKKRGGMVGKLDSCSRQQTEYRIAEQEGKGSVRKEGERKRKKREGGRGPSAGGQEPVYSRREKWTQGGAGRERRGKIRHSGKKIGLPTVKREGTGTVVTGLCRSTRKRERMSRPQKKKKRRRRGGRID